MNISRDRLKNPLIRDGVSQRQRYAAALSPDFVKVDERDLADVLVMAYHLSKKVSYYNEKNEEDRDWQSFFDSSPLVQLALISKTNPQIVREEYRQKREFFKKTPTPETLKEILDVWKNKILNPIETLDKTLSQVNTYAPLKILIQGLVKTNLPPSLAQMLAINQSVTTEVPTFYSNFAKTFKLNLQLSPLSIRLSQENLQNLDLDSTFQPLFQTYQQIVQQASDTLNAALKEYDLNLMSLNNTEALPKTRNNLVIVAKIENSYHARIFDMDGNMVKDDQFTPNATLKAELDAAFANPNIDDQTERELIRKITSSLGHTPLKTRQDHSPALALYIAFWYVMQGAKDDLNRITERHLDFFYRQVLRFPYRPAKPDRVHLVFELAKGQEEHKLTAGTDFKAGKDEQGKDLVYQLDQDTVIHKAQIASIKGLFLDLASNNDNSSKSPVRGVYVSPQANSADGKGGDFPKEQKVKAWLPFGNKKRDHASLGLAISSNIFYLQEGKRTITFRFSLSGGKPLLNNNQLNQEEAPVFLVSFSGEKDWIASKDVNATWQPKQEDNESILTLEVKLFPNDEPIVSYHGKLKGAALSTFTGSTNTASLINQPVARILLNDKVKIGDYSPYHYLRDAKLLDLEIEVQVDEVRNLVIQNDLSVLDTSKPFPPFGTQPKPGSNLYIGSKEVLEKQLTELTINLDLEQPPPQNWLDIYAGYDTFHYPDKDDPSNLNQINPKFEPGKLMIQALRQKTWHPAFATAKYNLLEGLTKYDLNLMSLNNTDALPQIEKNLVIVAKIGDSYHARIFDMEGKIVVDKELQPDATLKAELDAAFANPNIDDQTERELIRKITSSLGHTRLTIDLTSDLVKLELTEFDETESVEVWNLKSKNGFLRLRLAQGDIRSDFLHDEYPRVLARQTLAVATNTIIESDEPLTSNSETTRTDGSNNPTNKKYKRQAVIGAFYRKNDNTNTTVYKKTKKSSIDAEYEPIMPREPYLPIIQSLFLSYKAKATKEDYQLFQLTPFDGFVEIKKPFLSQESQGKYKLLPQFMNEGELLIGLENLNPPTALPLFFQVAEETADPELEKTTVNWFYLKDNTWCSLQDRIVSDTTNGLIDSGIVTLALPADISKAKTTRLDRKLYWIKASVANRTDAICEIIHVHTQAAGVTFQDRDNDPSHLATPLKAGMITKLVTPQAEIKKIEQPYVSFDGQVKERPADFYTRISEKLRHKGRAVTIFDYERLVLDKFPDIYKVRCVNHGQLDRKNQWQPLVPGSVTLVVIPDLSQRKTTRDLTPRVNLNRLKEMEEYLMGNKELAGLSSPWATIRVVNPAYETIQVSCEVAFKAPEDGNFGYYKRDLIQKITRFLAPWTDNSKMEIPISFGGKLYRSSILNFVEKLDYVDYVVNFQMHHHNTAQGSQHDVLQAIASTPRSILTSVSGQEINHSHLIEQISNTSSSQGPRHPEKLGYTPLNEVILSDTDSEDSELLDSNS